MREKRREGGIRLDSDFIVIYCGRGNFLGKTKSWFIVSVVRKEEKKEQKAEKTTSHKK